MTAINDVQFMPWAPRDNMFSFVCIVTYAGGRVYHFYGRVPATVRRYFRERALAHAPWPSCYGGKWCEARAVEELHSPSDEYLIEAFERGRLPL